MFQTANGNLCTRIKLEKRKTEEEVEINRTEEF